MSETINFLVKQGEIIGEASGGGGGDTSSLANKDDISEIQLTGTTNTSGSTITSGTYFYLNGSLVKAKADIASGATFTENTNYESVSVGEALVELNSNMNDKGTLNIRTIGYTDQYYVPLTVFFSVSPGRTITITSAQHWDSTTSQWKTVDLSQRVITMGHDGFNCSATFEGYMLPTGLHYVLLTIVVS